MPTENEFDQKLKVVEKLDDENLYWLEGFFQRISMPHLIEVVKYQFQTGNSVIVMNTGYEGIIGVLHSYDLVTRFRVKSLKNVRLFNVPFVLPQRTTDIGMMIAMHKKMLMILSGKKVEKIGYMVQEEDYLVNFIMSEWGFEKTDISKVQYRSSEYSIWTIDTNKHLESFHLNGCKVENLLKSNGIEATEYERHVAFQAALQIGIMKQENHAIIAKPKVAG